MAQDEIIQSMTSDMEKALVAFRARLSQVRTGRASVGLLDGIRIDYYGNMTPLSQVATLAVPEPRMITISPWEKSMLTPIEKAIQKSDLNLNPQNDGKLIRLLVPELTGERRKDLVKQVHKEGETSKVAMRAVRREHLEMVKEMEKDKEISEDDARRLQTKIQEGTDKFIAKLDELLVQKEREITDV